MTIELNRDIDTYQESVLMGLTAKQLLCSLASVAVGGGIILAIYPYVGLTVAAYIATPLVAPLALSGFFERNGMDFAEYLRLRLHFIFANPTLTYGSTEHPQENTEEETNHGLSIPFIHRRL